jgi:hypothetical protein
VSAQPAAADVRVALLETLGSVSVWEVDGEAVRRDLSIEFTDFGQHWQFPFIPEDEVWIDRDDAHRDEYRYFTDNALTQRRWMASGAGYERALAAGDRVERRERAKANVGSQADIKGSDAKVAACLLQPMQNLWPGRIQARYEPWLVDGEKVRELFDVNFTEGGNFCADWYVPAYQLWIDDALDDDDRQFAMLHEGVEAAMMERGLSYQQAHPRASAQELEARRSTPKRRCVWGTKAAVPSFARRLSPISDVDVNALVIEVTEQPEADLSRELLRLWSSFMGKVVTADDVRHMADTGSIPARLTAAIKSTYADFAAVEARGQMESVASEMAGRFLDGVQGANVETVRDLINGDAELSLQLKHELQVRSDRLAVEMSDDQHAAIQLLVDYYATDAAMTVGDLSTTLADFVGLTAREAGWVLNYRDELAKAEMSAKQTAELVGRYTERLERGRALRIARTETAFAATEGQKEGLREARDAGLVEGKVMKQWSTADDEATCDECAELGAAGPVGEDESFSTEVDDPPAHPNCRCSFDYVQEGDVE